MQIQIRRHGTLWHHQNIMKKKRNCSLRRESNFSPFPQYFQYISNFRSQIIYTFVKCGCSIHLFLNSANLICRGTDISKYFRESLGIRDNESRLYWFASFNQFRFLSVLQVCSTKYDPSLQHSDQFDKCDSDPLSVGNRSCCSGTNVATLILYHRTWINYHCHADLMVFASQIQMTCGTETCVQNMSLTSRQACRLPKRILTYLVFPKYWDAVTLYHICP